MRRQAEQLQSSQNETAQLLEAAEMLEQEVDANAVEKEELGKAFDKERRRLLAENQQLSREVQDLKGRLRLVSFVLNPLLSLSTSPCPTSFAAVVCCCRPRQAGISEPVPTPTFSGAKSTQRRTKGYAAALRKYVALFFLPLPLPVFLLLFSTHPLIGCALGGPQEKPRR